VLARRALAARDALCGFQMLCNVPVGPHGAAINLTAANCPIVRNNAN
jgi:hypothetical protein